MVFLLMGCDLKENSAANSYGHSEIADCELSEYEIFCKNYVYIKTEEEWNGEKALGILERIDNSVLEEKKVWDGDLKRNHVKGVIGIEIDKHFHEKDFCIADFHMIDAESVSFVMRYPEDSLQANQYYRLALKDKSDENLFKAIRKLEIFAFTKSAFLDIVDEING